SLVPGLEKGMFIEWQIRWYKAKLSQCKNMPRQKIEELGLDVSYYLVRDTTELTDFLNPDLVSITSFKGLNADIAKKVGYPDRMMDKYIAYVSRYGYGYWHLPQFSQAFQWFERKLQEIRDILVPFHSEAESMVHWIARFWFEHY